MICVYSDTWNAQNVRCGEEEAPPLTAGHAIVIGWSLGVRVQLGSCRSIEERSEVNFHWSSSFLLSLSRALPGYTRAAKSKLKCFQGFSKEQNESFLSHACKKSGKKVETST